MITTKNYYQVLATINRSSLEPELQETASWIDKMTKGGSDWSEYDNDPVVRETVDMYFAMISEIAAEQGKPAKVSKPKAPESFIVDEREKKTSQSRTRKPAAPKTPRVVTPKAPRAATPQAPRKTKPSLRVVKRKGEGVERISDELRFINRYVLLNGKVKTKDQIRLFLNALQRAITEKRVRKTSPFADDIRDIQNSLIKLYNEFSKSRKQFMEISIPQEKLNRYVNLVGKQEVLHSVRFLKSYIGMQGKLITNQRIKSLHNRIGKAVNDGRITDKDPYWNQVELMLENLKAFFRKNKDEGELNIPQRELNGLDGLVSGLNGFEDEHETDFVSSEDVLKMDFDTIGLTGKWLDFIGDPTRGFSAMIFGKPKFGKSNLAIDFAGYLARHHGRVLYCAREENIGGTLKEKLIERKAAHPQLIMSSKLPDDFTGFDFVFLDSVTKLGLAPRDLEELNRNYPDVSFIGIFQTTKQGAFRGENGYQHDVDVVIQIPEPGKAVQYGRFNQGGEMEIFQ